ncbi:glycosyltransferase family 4 protein [Microvirga massiliensis]|uniref:glycosyltransferase family 4 protein n=1 Tax=Microvirga massiliensis TaxID=1033741 RepID=UPI00062B3990|nr:glycosyltransferase family 4 protein [Microvirga massiliensis]
MRIFFFSTVFAPSVGGIERLAETLCAEFAAKGHDVRLATLTPCIEKERRPFAVIRRPSLIQFLELLRWSEIHIQANVSLKYTFPRVLQPKRLVYQHNNVYQRDDGTLGVLDHLKCLIARHTLGIANSCYTAGKLGCARTVYNAYDDFVFCSTVPWDNRDRDIVFLGRLVSQKGCDVLMRALGRLSRDGLRPSVTIIGDGPDRHMLEMLAQTAGVKAQVRFTGTLAGFALAAELNRHRVLVVPSTYEEPFGIVALEGLACGCLAVVSERGGLIEAIGPHGLTFPNGDEAALARTLAEVVCGWDVARARLAGIDMHLANYRASVVAERYLAIFEELLKQRSGLLDARSH